MNLETTSSPPIKRCASIVANYYGTQLLLADIDYASERNGFVAAITSRAVKREAVKDDVQLHRTIDPYIVELQHTHQFNTIYRGSGMTSFLALVEFANQRESKDLDRDGRPQPLISKSYVFSEQGLFKDFEGEESETLMQAQIVLNQDSRAEYLLHLAAVHFDPQNPDEKPERGIEITLQTKTYKARIYIPVLLDLVPNYTDDTKSEIARWTEEFFVMTEHTEQVFAKEIGEGDWYKVD